MADPFYVSHAGVTKIEGVHQRGVLRAGVTIDTGVHDVEEIQH